MVGFSKTLRKFESAWENLLRAIIERGFWRSCSIRVRPRFEGSLSAHGVWHKMQGLKENKHSPIRGPLKARRIAVKAERSEPKASLDGKFDKPKISPYRGVRSRQEKNHK